uniref:CN hydrolase domain-containing protein n=1 Tax=Leersia perrieri TaxID=77586 RepID=A0A0D9WN22_9ORYZ
MAATVSISPSPLPHPQVNITKYMVALLQLPVSPRKEENIARARDRIDAAAAAGAALVVLPASLINSSSLEIWNCPYSMETLPSYGEDIDGGASPSISMLSEVASRRRITIVGGSIPEISSSGKLFNTCCVIGTDGQIKAKHRKLHLFEIDIPGDITFRESDTFAAGQEPTIVDTDVGLIGIGICHDIRFPELAKLYRLRGAHLICYPSAFNMSTGELLWDLMQKSRAVDNQLFVVTCSPARDPTAKSDYMIWGHSSLIGPFGEVIATAGHEEETVIGEIDLSMIQTIRENLPLEMQRREDLYQLVDVRRKSSGDNA